MTRGVADCPLYLLESGSMFHRNVGSKLPNNMTSSSRTTMCMNIA